MKSVRDVVVEQSTARYGHLGDGSAPTADGSDRNVRLNRLPVPYVFAVETSCSAVKS